MGIIRLRLNRNTMVMFKMPKLACSVCGREINVPECCDQSMLVKDNMLCCCTDTCHHQDIPECCGQQMNYVNFKI